MQGRALARSPLPSAGGGGPQNAAQVSSVGQQEMPKQAMRSESPEIEPEEVVEVSFGRSPSLLPRMPYRTTAYRQCLPA